MARAAVLAGRAIADVATNLLSIVVLVITGLMGLRVPRAAGVLAGSRELDRLHRGVPAHVRVVGLRARGIDAVVAAGLRGNQPVHRHGRRHARAVGRRARGRLDLAGDPLVAQEIIAVFAPLAVARYRRTASK
jgi:hypothetical protein